MVSKISIIKPLYIDLFGIVANLKSNINDKVSLINLYLAVIYNSLRINA